MDDDPPELAGYVPHGGRPLRSAVVMRAMRVVIVLGVVGLVVPGTAATVALQSRNADYLCAQRVSAHEYGADPSVRFQLVGGGGPGWYCYAVGFDGREVLLGSLGLIPG